MSLGPELQRAIYRVLREDPGVREASGGDARVYDRVPPPSPGEADVAYQRRLRFPYITIGEDQVLDDSTACARAWEVITTTHVWSRAVGRLEAKGLADAVAAALDAALPVTGYRVTDHQHRETRVFTDPDGLTSHGVITHRYLIDPE